jgi:hypothetical protein
MIMFAFVDADYKDSVSLPDRNIYLSFSYFDQLGKHFLYMESYDRKDKTLPYDRFQVYGIRPSLYNYKALPYKRQSSVSELDKRISSLRINSFGFPWCDCYRILERIKGFYSSLKKQYAVIAHTCLPLSEDTKKVLITFDRYFDALSLIEDCGYRKVKSLLGSNFKPFNVLHPYLLVDYMGHPICLFSEIASYKDEYSLGYDWCYCFLYFLKDGSDQEDIFRSIFACAQRDRFSRVIHCNTSLD